MPDVAAHNIFAKQLLAKEPVISQAVQNRDCQAAFYWGACGPDFFYFHHVFSANNDFQNYGLMLHNCEMQKIIKSGVAYINNMPQSEIKDITIAYFYGLICHYAMDRMLHPYIFYQQYMRNLAAPDDKISAIHAAIEGDLDAALYKHTYNKQITDFNIRRQFSNDKKILQYIADLYVHIMKDIFNITITANTISSAILSMRRLCILLYEKSGAVGFAAHCVDKLTKKHNYLRSHVKKGCNNNEILNTSHENWYNVNFPTEIYNDSIYELIEKAALKAHELLKEASENIANKHHSCCQETGIMAQGTYQSADCL